MKSKSGNSQKKIWMGFDIKSEAGPLLRPLKINYWKENDFKKHKPDLPFHYRADAITGLSLIHLNQNLQNPFSSPDMNFPFAAEAWLHLEPHHELFNRAQSRILSLRKTKGKKAEDHQAISFERQCTEILEAALHPQGLDVKHLGFLIEKIDDFETKLQKPLLYNFEVEFSKVFVKKLHYLHSLLFHLRTLIAMDYNAHVQDVSHQALKVDSITDYIPRADYVANDAMTYCQFKKVREQIPASARKHLETSFLQYNHNGVHLIESLPASFISSMNQTELEETLYLVQMDWLLGTEAGILFRIREELYGLNEGYEKVFWPELEDHSEMTAHTLTVNCMLSEKDLFTSVDVA